MSTSTKNLRNAFTLIELLTTLGIISVLLAILLPAVQLAREAARKTACSSNLRQLGLAFHQYHDVYAKIPPGNSNGFSLFVILLPFIEQRALYEEVVFESVDNVQNRQIADRQLSLLLCPSDGIKSKEHGVTNYLGNYGTGLQNHGQSKGVFQHLSFSTDIGGGPLSFRDLTDGMSNTGALSETLIASGSPKLGRSIWSVVPGYSSPDDAPRFLKVCNLLPDSTSISDDWSLGADWMRGDHGATLYNHFQTPNHPSCTNNGGVFGGAWTAASLHRTGVELCLADASVRFVSDSVDAALWAALGTRANGDVVGDY